eukprot:SAG11_NODE_8467_length_1012_cov_0.662651_1_plen_83_part_00
MRQQESKRRQRGTILHLPVKILALQLNSLLAKLATRALTDDVANNLDQVLAELLPVVELVRRTLAAMRAWDDLLDEPAQPEI